MVYLSVYSACRVCPCGRRVSLVRRSLRRSSPHLNNSGHPFEQVDRLVRSRSVLVELFQDIDDDLGLGFDAEVRLRKRWLRDPRTGILAAKLGNDVVEVLLCSETLPFKQFHNRGDPRLERTRCLRRTLSAARSVLPARNFPHSVTHTARHDRCPLTDL